jgi:hypothetical protein
MKRSGENARKLLYNKGFCTVAGRVKRHRINKTAAKANGQNFNIKSQGV